MFHDSVSFAELVCEGRHLNGWVRNMTYFPPVCGAVAEQGSMCLQHAKPNSDSGSLRQSQGLFAGAKQDEWAARVQKSRIPAVFQGRDFKDSLGGEGRRVCDQLMDLPQMGWWRGNR